MDRCARSKTVDIAGSGRLQHFYQSVFHQFRQQFAHVGLNRLGWDFWMVAAQAQNDLRLGSTRRWQKPPDLDANRVEAEIRFRLGAEKDRTFGNALYDDAGTRAWQIHERFWKSFG